MQLRAQINVALTPELAEAIKADAEAQRLSVAALVRRIIDAYYGAPKEAK